MIEEVFAAMSTPMEGFFDGANVVVEVMASATPAAAQGVLAETPIPSAKPKRIEEGAQTKRVNESASIPTKTPTLQKGVTPATTSKTKIAFPFTPFVISTSDPFAALSQTVKDGSSLVVTPSYIPSSTTCGPNADLSSDEGSKEVLEDSDDKPTMKKRVSDSDKEGSDKHETEAMGTYSLHLLGFFSILYRCCLFYFSFYIYLNNFLMQSLFILHVHSSNHRDS